MSPSPRAALIAGGLALAVLVVPPALVVLGAVGLVVATVVDVLDARRPVSVVRAVPGRLARGVTATMSVTVDGLGGRRVLVRQPLVPDIDVVPSVAHAAFSAAVVARRRGRHELPPLVVRTTGSLGLARWDRTVGAASVVEVLPDLPAAHRLAAQVRQRRFRHPGTRRRGPIGLGTNFDQIRDYQPDDDIRHVNWVATARQGRPMTNQYREDTERDVVVLLDCGRLTAAPVAGVAPGVDAELRAGVEDVVGPAGGGDAATRLARSRGAAFDGGAGATGNGGAGERRGPGPAAAVGGRSVGERRVVDRTRLDVAVDVAVAVVAVADVLGDRGGLVAFDDEVRARVSPRRGSGDAVVRAVHDMEAWSVDSDPDVAFRAVGTTKRALVVVLTDLVDEAAAQALLEALPYLVRRHAVVVASCRDDDLEDDAAGSGPTAVVARRVLDARDAVVARVRHTGARVVEAPAERLSAAVVAAYLDAKATARI